ncbi:MAG: peptidoglycan DD-metalloendopeptidase family protein [Candidatus Chisholmbacteria bacterium]|nr:peptidoglycan DD-metalloendopeptidase family protein [Candidatus Chisholmbacteria bacterium]
MSDEPWWREIGTFLAFVYLYARKRAFRAWRRFEFGKGILVEGLYQQRGKYARPFTHSGMVGLVMVGITMGPLIINQFPDAAATEGERSSLILGQTAIQAQTVLSEKPRAEVVDYTVAEGDTLSSVAEKFGVSLETVLWANDLTAKSTIKPGTTLAIPPVTGVVHKVGRGETIYSIAKKYDVEAQNIVNWPYNSYANDETFALAVGQVVVVPDGVMPEAAPPTSPRYIARKTPDAGAVTATGQFVWPTQGTISQQPVWYHMALDISNRGAPDILAADSGTVILAGWPDGGGYGNRIIIDHGNGYETLYAHLSGVYVSSGQTVSRGTAIGKMGSTGRSTGTHLHFEVRKDGVLMNPWGYLQ